MRSLLALAVVAALASPAAADGGTGKPPEPQQPAQEAREENPLPSIERLMRDVERRLADCDAGEWTQEEEARLADAVAQSRGAVDALNKLIEDLENRGGA